MGKNRKLGGAMFIDSRGCGRQALKRSPATILQQQGKNECRNDPKDLSSIHQDSYCYLAL